jgi:hypothetical protein
LEARPWYTFLLNLVRLVVFREVLIALSRSHRLATMYSIGRRTYAPCRFYHIVSDMIGHDSSFTALSEILIGSLLFTFRIGQTWGCIADPGGFLLPPGEL